MSRPDSPQGGVSDNAYFDGKPTPKLVAPAGAGRGWWPFKTGPDERTVHAPKTVYDTIGDRPRADYDTEVQIYQESKWRRGFIVHCLPSCVGVGALGGFGSLWMHRRGHIRHVPRAHYVLFGASFYASLAVATTGCHHLIVALSDYRTADWQAGMAGVIGGVYFALGQSGIGSGTAMLGGYSVALGYTLLCYMLNKHNLRAYDNFFGTQQSIETPIHRIAPEMQQMYRAYLYDHRPLEDTPIARREARVSKRLETDTRIDAESAKQAFNDMWNTGTLPLPKWFPFFPVEEPHPVEKLYQERKRQENHDRGVTELLKGEQLLLKRPMRAQSGRDLDKMPTEPVQLPKPKYPQ